MGAFFGEALPCSEEERNITEAVAINEESTRGKGLSSRLRIDIWFATVRNIFSTVDFARLVLAANEETFQIFLAWLNEALKYLGLFCSYIVFGKAFWLVHVQ